MPHPRLCGGCRPDLGVTEAARTVKADHRQRSAWSQARRPEGTAPA